jgi:hypothetical protein
MVSGNDSTSPSRDSQDRSSTGIRGPYQIPVDDVESEIDVPDATIVDLEDGFTFFRRTPPQIVDPVERYEVFGASVSDDPSIVHMRETSLERNWLVEHGES